jgi:natural product precursor
MKTKKLNKKLTLSKKTIAHLENSEMNAARGGETEPVLCIFTKKECSEVPCPVTWPGHTCIDC